MRHWFLGFTVILGFGCGFASQCIAQVAAGGSPSTADVSSDSVRAPQEAGAPATDAATAILYLDSRPTPADGENDGGLLIREIFRQALLIAGREELGLVTRDATLADLSPEASLVNVTAHLIPSKSIHLEVTRRRDGQDEVVWKKTLQGDFKAGEQVDYTKLVEVAEEFSRNEFVEVLTQCGWTKTLKTQAPSENEAKLDGKSNHRSLSFVDQFAEVRRVHAMNRSLGQSPDRLARLALGYANLGQLTLFHWNAAHKAFEARALLYGQRLHLQDKPSPVGYWIKAYAEAMAGLEATALHDLETAEKLYDAMKQDDRPQRPPWVDLIDSFCHYDTSELLRAGRTPGPYQSLALLLAVRTLEHTSARSALLDTAQRALEVEPECYRIIDAMCRVGGVGNLHFATMLGPETLKTSLPERLRAVADLPTSVAEMLKPDETNNAAVEWARALLGLADVQTGPASWTLAQGLVDASAADRGEPSWGVLGRLISETIFIQAQRRANFMRYSWSVPTDDYVSSVLPTLSGHPYRGFIDSYRFDGQRERENFHGALKDIDMRDPQVKMVSMIRATWELNAPGKIQGVEAWRLAFLHGDATSTDLTEVLASTRRQAKVPYAKSLFEVSPHSPLAMATLIYFDWNFASDHAARWEEQHSDHPAVSAALAWRYHSLRRYADAEPLLRRCIEASPDKWAYDTLAEGYIRQGKTEKWLQTLEEFLTQPDYRLDHASVRVKIARHYMEKERWEDARPYALAAAQTWAAWAMKCAAECEEGLGNWEDAELWAQRISERYDGTGRVGWYLWCKRTGHGDVEQAKRLTDAWMNSVRQSNNLNDIRLTAVLHILAGRQREALDAFLRTYDEKKLPYDGIHVALLATEVGDERARSDILKRIVQTKPGGGGQTEHRFARVLHDHFNGEVELDLKFIDDVLSASNKVERCNIEYFAGRFLELAGRKDEALKYLKQSALHGDKARWNVVLASDLLRSQDIDLNEDK